MAQIDEDISEQVYNESLKEFSKGTWVCYDSKGKLVASSSTQKDLENTVVQLSSDTRPEMFYFFCVGCPTSPTVKSE